MGILTKAKALWETYFAQRSGIQLDELIKNKADELMLRAPFTGNNLYPMIQPDGGVVIMEPERSDGELSDELALRKDMGGVYADRLQQKATKAGEEISLRAVNFRDVTETLNDHQEKQNELLSHTTDYHFAKREAAINLAAFVAVSLGEIAALFFLFLDFFGVDPLRLGAELAKRLPSTLGALAFGVSYFAASILIAKQAFYSNQRIFWFILLAVLAFITGELRCMQAAALNETDINAAFQVLIFAAVSFVLPLTAAYYEKNWQDAAQITGQVESVTRRYAEQEDGYRKRLDETIHERGKADKELDSITDEYVKHYQKAMLKQEKLEDDWEFFSRYMSARLSEIRLAYLFWHGYRAKGSTVFKPVAKLARIGALLLLVFALTLTGALLAHAENGFNVLVECDRSSSAGEYACTSDTLKEAGRMWIEKASEVGGGTFEIFLIDRGFDNTVLIFSEKYPERFPGPVMLHKKKWKTAFSQRLSQKTANLPVNMGSAIVEALQRSSLRIPREGETLFVVLSDMREVNNVFNFEKRVPVAKDFMAYLDAAGIRPAFPRSTKIVACGLHPYAPGNTSTMNAQNYGRLVALWQTVFNRWGLEARMSEICNLAELK